VRAQTAILLFPVIDLICGPSNDGLLFFSYRMTCLIRFCSLLAATILIATTCFAQQHSFTQLDTVIDLGIRASDCFDGSISFAAFDKETLIYLPSIQNIDTISFLRWTRSGGIDTLHAWIPGLPLRIKDPVAQQLSFNAEFVVLSFWQTILILNRNGEQGLSFREMIPMAESFSYLKMLPTKLLIGRCYDYNPKDASEPTMLILYDIPSRQFSSPISPPFQSIEFTLFKPLHLIDASDHWIAYGQTQSYNVELYDRDLKPRYHISRTVKAWKPVDTSFLAMIRKRGKNPRGTIALLDSVEAISSRVESVDFLDDSTLSVRYIPPSGNIFPRKRLFDIWRLEGKEWVIAQKDLIDQSPPIEAMLTHTNSPLGSGYGNCQYEVGSGWSLINAHFVAPISRLGLTTKDLRDREETYVAKQEPRLHLFLYSVEHYRK
jgi:hypothetical protein